MGHGPASVARSAVARSAVAQSRVARSAVARSPVAPARGAVAPARGDVTAQREVRRGRIEPGRLLWLVYALFFASGVAQAAIVPLLPRLSGLYGLSPSATALLLALPGLATLAVSVPAGLAADRFGARRVTLGSGALLCLACLAQAAPSLPALLLGRVAFGLAFGVVWTTGMAWVAELGEAAAAVRLGPAVTCSSVGMMVGPAVGGGLGQQGGVAPPFLLIAGVAALIVVPLGLGSPVQRCTRVGPDADRAGRAGGSLRHLSDLARRPGVGAAAAALIVSGAVSGVSQLLITIGLHDNGLSAAAIGLAFSAASVSYIAISAMVVRLGSRASTPRVNALATLALALALAPALGGGAAALVAALLLTAVPRAAISTIAYSLAAAPVGEGSGPATTATTRAAGATLGAAGDGTAASRLSGDERECPPARTGDGFVFGMLNGAWAGAMVLTPMLAGALQQSHGAASGYLIVIVPSCLVGAGLIARSRPARPRARRCSPAAV